jgi:hypothetical protein
VALLDAMEAIALVSGAGPEEMSYRVVGSSVHPVTTELANADVIGDAPHRLDGAHSPADIDLATDEGEYTSWPT